MARSLSPARFAMALVFLCFSFSCGEGKNDGDPPIDPGPGPSTGSVCPSEETLTYENFGRGFLEAYCTRCHSSELSGSERHGAPAGYNWDLIESVREHAALIDRMAAAGPIATNTTMPPRDDPAPTVAEREQLGEWLECGAP
ncbi:MAG TPA: hypothetical protein VFZ53_34525 [Polyangiaceae bacterium]